MLHESCAAAQPLNTQAGKCTTQGCKRGTSSAKDKLCRNCSAVTGDCEACGKPMITKKKVPSGGLGIAPGGCMDMEGQIRAMAKTFFERLEGFQKLECSRQEFVVYLAETSDDLPPTFYRRPVRYVCVSEAPKPTAASWVTVVVKQDTKLGAKQKLLTRIKGLPGVVSVELLFPDDNDDYLARFYAVGVQDKKSAEALVEELSELNSVEHSTVSAGRTAFKK